MALVVVSPEGLTSVDPCGLPFANTRPTKLTFCGFYFLKKAVKLSFWSFFKKQKPAMKLQVLCL